MEPTHTVAGEDDSFPGTSFGVAGGWSGLHDDILGLVLARLDSSRDHACFAATCTSWRSLVSTRPPRRVHPWLVLNPHDQGDETKRVYCPGDGAVLPLDTRLHETIGGIRCFVGCHPGGWVAHEAPLRITNAFSGAEVALPADQRWRFVTRKVIFSESPASSDCILAAITDSHEEVVISGLGSPECGWATRKFFCQHVADIAFCNGHLYCLVGANKDVAKFEVSLDRSGMPTFGAFHWLTVHNHPTALNYMSSEGDPDAYAIYIFELQGELVMAVRRTSVTLRSRVPFFKVLKLVDAGRHDETGRQSYNWVVVTSLSDHVLFLGPTCSKAMHVSTGERGGPRKNHIYYAHHICFKRKKRLPDIAKEFLTSSNKDGCRVHYKEDESNDNSAEEITSVGYYVRGDGHPPMWLFPQDL